MQTGSSDPFTDLDGVGEVEGTADSRPGSTMKASDSVAQDVELRP